MIRPSREADEDIGSQEYVHSMEYIHTRSNFRAIPAVKGLAKVAQPLASLAAPTRPSGTLPHCVGEGENWIDIGRGESH